MAKNLVRTDADVIDAAVTAGEELLGRLAGRCNNLAETEYDELVAIVEAMPVGMDYEEHRWINTRVVNAKDASIAGAAAYEIRQLIRRLRHKHGVTT
jgi:hypothetical protein